MSRGERKAMIVRDHPDLSVSRQCGILSIGRSSLYYRPKGKSPESLVLMRRIDELFLKYPFYGSRQMARQLRREGVCVGRHRVRRLMLLMGLQAIYQAPRTSTPHPEHRIYPYLLKGLAIERLWRSLKYEAVYLHELTDGFKAERVIGEWIGFYNSERPHSALGGQTPAEA